MDPITVAAGSALVGAMATDAWEQIREAVVALWRRARPEAADTVGPELEELRAEVLRARRDTDEDTESALAGAWRLRLHQLLRQAAEDAQDTAQRTAQSRAQHTAQSTASAAELAAELRGLLDELLLPALSTDERTEVRALVQHAVVSGGVSVQAGRDVHQTLPHRPEPHDR